MTAAPTWSLPSGRILNGWWRDLSAWQPQRLWFSHLLLHRVEALASVESTQQLDAFQQGLLQRFGAAPARGVDCVAREQLQVDRQLLSQWLDALARQGLLQATASGWEFTEAGRQAAETGAFRQASEERRVFYFVDNRTGNQPAHFLALALPGLPYPAAGDEWQFDPRWLTDCLQRPPEWKRRHRFPDDVQAISQGVAAPVAAGGQPEAAPWRRVLLDRPEQLPVVFILTRDAAAGDTIQGFSVHAEDWKLRDDKPILTVSENWQAVLPELTVEPPLDAWRASWQGWCRRRNLPALETDGCPLHRSGLHLEVQVSKRLSERLKTSRHDAPRVENWVLAGTGRTQTAACLKFVEGVE